MEKRELSYTVGGNVNYAYVYTTHLEKEMATPSSTLAWRIP